MTSAAQTGGPVDDTAPEIGELLAAARLAATGNEQIDILEQVHAALRQQLTVASRD